MKKIIFTLLLASGLAFGVASCGDAPLLSIGNNTNG